MNAETFRFMSGRFGSPRRSCYAVLLVAVSVAAVLPACREKEPYSAGKAPAARKGPWGLSSPPGAPAEPVPVAAVLTPEGTILATARPGGRDLDIRKLPIQVYVRDDGSVTTFSTRVEKRGKKGPSTKESVFTTLVADEGGSIRQLFPGEGQARPDLDELGKMDPDLAALYYHREEVSLLGISGSLYSWVVSTDGYLGGAHPYAQRSLLVYDAETGGRADLKARFPGFDPALESRRASGSEDCLTRYGGAAPVDWLGGDAVWLAFFTNEFETCGGRYRLVRIPPPKGSEGSRPAGRVSVAKGVFEVPEDNLKVSGVADWRATDDGGVAVLLMTLGKRDRLKAPWKGRKERRSREMRVWIRGMKSPVVVGRATRILSVQFLNEHPDPRAVLAAFTALETSVAGAR